MKRVLVKAYKAAMERKLSDSDRERLGLPEDATYADALALAMVRRAISGDVKAAARIRKAVEGKR